MPRNLKIKHVKYFPPEGLLNRGHFQIDLSDGHRESIVVDEMMPVEEFGQLLIVLGKNILHHACEKKGKSDESKGIT